MSDSCFFDTNTIVYLYSEDEKEKQHRILSLISNRESNFISPQVINETINVMHRKMKIDYQDINNVIAELLENFAISDFTVATIKIAVKVADKYGFSYYDSLIIASALESNCQILYTEDMHHQQIIDNSLKIVNPFK